MRDHISEPSSSLLLAFPTEVALCYKHGAILKKLILHTHDPFFDALHLPLFLSWSVPIPYSVWILPSRTLRHWNHDIKGIFLEFFCWTVLSSLTTIYHPFSMFEWNRRVFIFHSAYKHIRPLNFFANLFDNVWHSIDYELKR
jgi:hypothetical protein